MLTCVGHKFRYETENVARIFLGDGVKSEDTLIVTELEQSVDCIKVTVTIKLGEAERHTFDTLPITSTENDRELALCTLLFKELSDLTGKTPRWGILTGVRPVRFIRTLLSRGVEEDSVKEVLKNRYRVADDMIELAHNIHERQKLFLPTPKLSEISIYIGIPFCPTICSYCSFVSQAVGRAGEQIEQYLTCLKKEIEHTAQLVTALGLTVKTVYIGGGTPTSITAHQLDQLLRTIEKNFDLSTTVEYTIEAGRADTIDYDKLMVIKNSAATRISINPQSLNDDVLKIAGRNHTAEDVFHVYNLARKIGVGAINMDIIAGLYGDSVQSFCDTVDKIAELRPENVTVHTLTVKRASRINMEKLPTLSENDTETMVDYARRTLTHSAYSPYYMYRQKSTVNNLENIGYTLDGFEGLYNVYIMDETHSILSLGAGGITKLCLPDGSYIERVQNFKYSFEYISRFDEIIERKTKITEFYKRHLL